MGALGDRGFVCRMIAEGPSTDCAPILAWGLALFVLDKPCVMDAPRPQMDLAAHGFAKRIDETHWLVGGKERSPYQDKVRGNEPVSDRAE